MYKAIEQVRKENLSKYKKDVGPKQPKLYASKNDHDLKSCVLRFIHERCEDLNFDEAITKIEKEKEIYKGTSLKENQIPYNMQMDINRLCLERQLEKFIDSGVAEDAYNIYYCYLEMFFSHYGKSKKMVELLSEFESNGSSLLMKHRDHFSHSVYVFALGLAVFETNKYYREAFKNFYKLNDRQDNYVANIFLEYWGLTSLFHDIGYPFELPFEQVLSYYEVDNQVRGKHSPFIAYKNIDTLNKLSKKEKKYYKDLYNKEFNNFEELLAYDITQKLGKDYNFNYNYIKRIIRNKPINPEKFIYHMDHAYFSACRLYRELIEEIKIENINKKHIDSLTAILLHNSLYKFSISYYKDKDKFIKPLPMDLHPLAYLLMYCDELQCWDRTSYGRNSRKQLHPLQAEFDFSNNQINVTYCFDNEDIEKIEEYKKAYKQWKKQGCNGKAPRLKAYSDMVDDKQSFVDDINRIIDTEKIPLTVKVKNIEVDRKRKHTYLSNSNFLHLYDFAVALNARYNYQDKEENVSVEKLETEFDKLSLEYQLSNINQAKNFSKYLNSINCFYTDKPVDYDMVKCFNKKQLETIAPLEHERWISEKHYMDWTKGDDYETLTENINDASNLRELFRQHKLAMEGSPNKKLIYNHYLKLSKKEKTKDYAPFNRMLKLIKKFDGLRIYILGNEK